MRTQGTFEINGPNLTLNPSSGGVWRGTINGKTIIDPEGMPWTKK